MLQAYIKQLLKKEPAAPVHYFEDSPVDAGWVLELLNVCCWWEGIAAAENVNFYVDSNPEINFLTGSIPSLLAGKPSWCGRVFVGEGCVVGAYAPASDTDDVVHLEIFGVLHKLDDWIKQP